MRYFVFVFMSLIIIQGNAQENDKEVKKLNIKIGYATFNYSNPSLTGENSFFNSGGINSSLYDGYRNLSGISFKLSYFLNN